MGVSAQKLKPLFLWVVIFGKCFSGVDFAEAMIPGIQPEDIHIAESRPTDLFVTRGVISGGDQAVENVTIERIRRSPEVNQRGYERIVLDLVGHRNGKPVPLKMPPFFFVGIKSAEKKVDVTVFGNPHLGFDAKSIVSEAKKMAPRSIVKSIELLPLIDQEQWKFSLQLKEMTGVRVFYLSNHARIIIDLKAKSKR